MSTLSGAIDASASALNAERARIEVADAGEPLQDGVTARLSLEGQGEEG